MTAIKQGRLVPRPEFQRRLVWSTKHKNAFLDTVLRELPFPEIYIAAGSVDVETGEGTEMLVDGQQRISTLYQYFHASSDLKLEAHIPTYASLQIDQKNTFLEYEVVVRDLGHVSIDQIKEVFQRINSTKYSLNAMEVANARYDGAFKAFGDEIATHDFFDSHKVFTANEIHRMQDVRLALILTATIMSDYFNRDDALEGYLEQYNDEFLEAPVLRKQINMALSFIDSLQLEATSRAFKKADLLTLVVEIHRQLFKKHRALDASDVRAKLLSFYKRVDERTDPGDKAAEEYYLAAVQASNDRVSRVRRGLLIQNILDDSATKGLFHVT